MSFQVIQRDQTDNSVDRFQDRLQQQQQMLLKAREIKSTLEIEREKLKIQQKHAKTEEEKMSLDKRVKNFEMATKYNEILTKSYTKPDGSFDGEGYEKSFSQLLMQPGNEDLVQELGNLQTATRGAQMGDVESAKTAAEIGGLHQKGRMQGALADIYGGMNRGEGMGAPATSGGVPTEGGMDVPAQGTPPGGQQGSPWAIRGIGESGYPDLVNLDTEQRLSAMKAGGTLQGEKEEGRILGETTINKIHDNVKGIVQANNLAMGLLSNPAVRQYMGPFGAASRAASLFTPEGRQYRILNSQAIAVLNSYRTPTTGAQASAVELEQFIKSVTGSLKGDVMETFLPKTVLLSYAHLTDLKAYKDLYQHYDTSFLDEPLNKLASETELLRERLKEGDMDIDSFVQGMDVSGTQKEIAKIMFEAIQAGVDDLTYDDAKRAVLKSKARR